MDTLRTISDSEWIIMKHLWDKAPRTANELVALITSEKEWKPNTIKTLINRLVSKGFVNYKKEGKIYHYFPGIAEQECKQKERKSFLKKVYDGSVKPLLASFIEDEQLTDSEIEDLMELLHNKKKD